MYRYIFSFILYLALLVFYIVSQYNSRMDIYKQDLKTSVSNSLNAAVNSFELLNDSYHNQNEAKMALIIKDANGASTKKRDDIRYKLRKEFTSLYDDRKLAHLDSFHIFDKNGYSLLRFHRLDKYDDKIIDLRPSLKNISQKLTAQSGFEVGLYALTYRFQYPLFYDGEFVGSYEFGIKFNAIDKEMQKLFGIKNVLFIHKEDIHNISKVQNKYDSINIAGDSFYILKTKMESDIFNRFQRLFQLLQTRKKKINHQSNFIQFSFGKKNYMAIVTPINDINHKHIGFILTGTQDNVSGGIKKTSIEELVIAILFGLVILFLVYKELEYKKYIRNIIDTQKEILIVTDGIKIHDVNKTFLQFFGFKTLNSFKKEHNCICDYFIPKSGYVQKDIDGVNWFDYIKSNPDKENIVIMYNKKNERKYFKIIIEGFSHSDSFIILFTDVTKELNNKKELENKAYYDSLTNIYSRDRFDYFLKKKLNQKREFSIIMFDIDHFKAVNDDYGHDVGDIILKEITTLVSTHIRKDDIFARWGGEEFMIVVGTDITKAERFANKLRRIIEYHNFQHIKNVTCSFGVAEYRQIDKVDTIIKRVDTMLYSAKESGRNCVVAVT